MLYRFKNQEEEYLLWLKENPAGYVASRYGFNIPEFNTIHKASCFTLHREAEEGVRTVHEKICVDSFAELVKKVPEIRENPGMWTLCRLCRP